MPFAKRARDLSITMTEWPSVTGTPGEAGFADRLREELTTSPAFHDHPEHLFTVDSHGDPMAKNLVGLVLGTGRRTVVLAGHFDTVSIANYGTLADLACQPKALTEALIAELTSRPRNAAEDLALADLLGGDFVPGRGLLDMKSGLAAGIAALEHFASLDERPGNILFIATPDEENRSRGMRSIRNALPAIARRFDLDIVGGINLDSVSDRGDGAEGRSVHLGSVGKFMPFAFVIGRPTHAGYPYHGISAALIASSILSDTEASAGLSDEAHGERSPPPVCLMMRDLRDGYDVTTPEQVFLAMNWLTHSRSAEELLATFAARVDRAAQSAIAAQATQAKAFSGRAASAAACAVVTYSELRDLASDRAGDAAIAAFDQDGVADPGDDPLSATGSRVAALVRLARLEGPTVVIGLASLHYPMVHIDRFGADGMRFRDRIDAAVTTIEARHGTSIMTRQFFAGISDMSFFGHRPSGNAAGFIAANTPCPTFADQPADDALSFPVVNIGPWGRDYHQKWERVHAPYTFDILPDLVFEAARSVLGE